MKNKIRFRYPLFLLRFPLSLLWIALIFSVEVSNGQSPADRTQVHIEQAKICDLFSDLPRYKDKEFDVDAIFVSGFEMGWLDSKEPCSKIGLKWATQFRFAENYEKETDRKVLKKFEKRLRNSRGSPKKVTGSYRVTIKDSVRRGNWGQKYEFEFIVLRINSVE